MNRHVARAFLLVFVTAAPAGAGEAAPRFGADVLPILKARCLKCHSSAQRKGGLSLRTPAAMLEGGDNGSALVKGKADSSLGRVLAPHHRCKGRLDPRSHALRYPQRLMLDFL
jgi:hypothetical protein